MYLHIQTSEQINKECENPFTNLSVASLKYRLIEILSCPKKKESFLMVSVCFYVN